jgi:hypothetical protein
MKLIFINRFSIPQLSRIFRNDSYFTVEFTSYLCQLISMNKLIWYFK